MRCLPLLAFLGLSTAAQGCSLIYTGTSDIAAETKTALTRHQLAKRARKQAKAAWQLVAAKGSYSKDYEGGFKAGFVRAAWWGTEDPPVIPPKSYWSAGYQSPEGHQAIADWDDGFRLGMSVATQTGAALSVKLPSPDLPSSPLPAPEDRVPATPPDVPREIAIPQNPETNAETLPPPRLVPHRTEP
jgi:hypothetical protein